MTDKQWRAVWVLSETAGNLEGDAQRDFLRGARVDADVESEVIRLFEELESEPNYPAAAHRESGDVVGRYVLDKRIGRGGMGEVYSAEDRELRRAVALKFLPAGVACDDRLAAQIISEARLASRLNHPNIVTVHEVIVWNGLPVIVMELVEGKPLRTMCGERAMPVAMVLRIEQQILQALAVAHANGIVHRDIKPENIMVRDDGFVKILDFGLARRSTASSEINLPDGTLRYMSPEQCRGESVTPASDVFSAGVVLYEIFAGSHPFHADSPLDTAHNITWVEPRPLMQINPEISSDINALVLRMLAKKANERPTAQSAADALTSVTAAPEVKAHRAYSVGVMLVIFVALLSSAVMWWTRSAERAKPSVELENEPKLTLLAGLRGLEQKPAFSPDGSRVAFEFSSQTSPLPSIYVKEIVSGKLTRLTNERVPDFQPAFSSDGTKLAFLRRETDGKLRVMIMPSEGGIPRPVGEVAGDIQLSFRTLTWDGRGTHVIVADDAATPQRQVSLFAIDAETGARRQITFPKPNESDRMPQMSPDKRLLGFVRVDNVSGLGRLLAVPLGSGFPAATTNSERPLAGLPESIWGWGWGRNASDLLISFVKGGSADLFRLSVLGGAAARVRGVDEQVRDLAVSQQGRLVYSPSVARAASIWEYSTALNQEPKVLISSTAFDSDPRFSPEGRQIAFASSRSGDGTDIWVCQRDGSEPTKVSLFDQRHSSGSPNWSPDGKWILYDTSFPKSPSSIYVSDILGGKPKRLTGPGSTDMTPNWSQDGRRIYYSSDRGGSRNIWKVSFAGGEPEQITRNGGFECFESVIDNTLYFTKQEGKGGIWRISLAGGKETPVTGLENLNNRYWEGSKKGIYFVQAEKPNPLQLGVYFALPMRPAVLKFFSFATGKAAILKRIPEQPQAIYRGLSLSSDGLSMLYMQGEWNRSNLMVLSNWH